MIYLYLLLGWYISGIIGVSLIFYLGRSVREYTVGDLFLTLAYGGLGLVMFIVGICFAFYQAKVFDIVLFHKK